jgi:hypothetical protein
VDAVLAKGATSEAGKLNNYDLKVMIKWFKRNDDKAMPTNKEGLLLRDREKRTCVVHCRGTYQHKDVATAVADCQASSCFAFASTSQATSNTFALAADGSQNAAYVVLSTNFAPQSYSPLLLASPLSTVAVVTIIVDLAVPTVIAHQTPTSDKPNAPSYAPLVDWGGGTPL